MTGSWELPLLLALSFKQRLGVFISDEKMDHAECICLFQASSHVTRSKCVSFTGDPVSTIALQKMPFFFLVHFWQCLFQFFLCAKKVASIIGLYYFQIPCLTAILLRAWMKESVSIWFVTSTWTARLTKHVNMAPYILRSDRFSLIRNGQNMLTPK